MKFSCSFTSNTHISGQIAIKHYLCRNNEFHHLRSHTNQSFFFPLFSIEHFTHLSFLIRCFFFFHKKTIGISLPSPHLIFNSPPRYPFFHPLIIIHALHLLPPPVWSMLVDWCRPPRCSSRRRKRTTWLALRCPRLAPRPPRLPQEIRWERKCVWNSFTLGDEQMSFWYIKYN